MPRVSHEARGVANEAEAHYRRMSRLGEMSAAELRARFAANPKAAAPWIESAARYGVVEAQVLLGQLLLDGEALVRDAAAARAWFERAAALGSLDAMNMAGRCHENGWGGPVDLPRAAAWYRRAAEAGHDWGAYNLANLLFDGRGVALDLAAAATWYEVAARQGHARAMNLLARACEEGWGIARDPAAARRWYRASAEVGYFRAQYNHATLLAAEGCIEDAAVWFEKALAGASPESLTGMTDALAHHPNPRLAAIAAGHAAA